jgi:hypothetical protein
MIPFGVEPVAYVMLSLGCIFLVMGFVLQIATFKTQGLNRTTALAVVSFILITITVLQITGTELYETKITICNHLYAGSGSSMSVSDMDEKIYTINDVDVMLRVRDGDTVGVTVKEFGRNREIIHINAPIKCNNGTVCI